MALSVDLENSILDAIFHGGTLHFAQIFISLHTGDPGQTGANEVVGGTYSRQLGVYPAAGNGQTKNSETLSFPGMPSCTVTHFGVWSVVSGPGFQWGGSLTSPQILNNGGVFDFLANQLAHAIG